MISGQTPDIELSVSSGQVCFIVAKDSQPAGRPPLLSGFLDDGLSDCGLCCEDEDIGRP
jgi:hypothetical protein